MYLSCSVSLWQCSAVSRDECSIRVSCALEASCSPDSLAGAAILSPVFLGCSAQLFQRPAHTPLSCADQVALRMPASLLMPQQPVHIVCAGHARKLVSFDQQFDPGYQGAYGIMAEVESHPFDLDTMLFMDWRDDHTQVGHSGSFIQQWAAT